MYASCEVKDVFIHHYKHLFIALRSITMYINFLVYFASRYNFKAFVTFILFSILIFPIKYQESLTFLVFYVSSKF